MKVTKICKCCNCEFLVPKYRAISAIYCSRKCLGKDRIVILHSINIPLIKNKKPYNFKGVSKHCLFCNKEFYLSPSRLGKTKFCSQNCYTQYQKNDMPKVCYTKENGKGQHRTIAEKFLKRPLLANEIVHHIDGDKRNNEFSNLVIMDRIDHIKLHSKYRFNPAPFELFAHIKITSF